MKILHICLGNFFIDNYSYQENMLSKYHVLQGHEVTVLASLVTFDKSGKYSLLDKEKTYYSEDGYKVIRVDYKKTIFRKLNKLLRIYNNVYETIKSENPDIIFIHNCQFWDIRQVKKHYLNCNHKIKIFVDNHADYINSATNWLSKNILHKIIWRYCANLIEPFTIKFYGVTPVRCDFLETVYKVPKEKIELLVMGVDDILVNELNCNNNDYRNHFFEELDLSKKDFIITTGGKIDPAKNIHLLMQAVREINIPNIQLVIFGNVAPEIKKLFDSLNSHTSIKYIGWKNHKDIIKILSISNLVVFPGTHSVLWEESVGCGIPALFKYWKGMTHVDVGGNCIFMYDDSVKEIKENVLRIYNDSTIYSSMLKASILKKELFSYSFISRKAIEPSE